MADDPFTVSEIFAKGMPKTPGKRRRAAIAMGVVAVASVLGLVAALIEGSIFGVVAGVVMALFFGGLAVDLRRPVKATGPSRC